MSLSYTSLSRCVVVLIAALFVITSANSAYPATQASGDNEPATLVTLSEFIAAGLKDNPSIKAKRLQWKRVIRKYPQARALEDPVLAYTEAIEPIETRLGPNRRSIMLSQKFPFPGKLKLKGDIVNKDVAIARVALTRTARDVVRAVNYAYFDLYYLDKATSLAKERINLFFHFTRAETNDYSIGVTGFSDVISAETRYADAEYDLILFTELRGEAETRMNALIGRAPEEPVGPLKEPIITAEHRSLEELYRLAGENEELLMAALLIEKNELKEKLSGFTSRPNFMVGLKYTDIGKAAMSGVKDSGKDAVAVNVGMTIPLWAGKNRAAKAEATLARMSSEHARAALALTLSASVKKAYVDMKSNYQLVRLYSDSLIPRADELIELSQINYKNGKGSIADLFESRVMRINFSLAYHRGLSNYMKNRAELERLTAAYALKEVARDD